MQISGVCIVSDPIDSLKIETAAAAAVFRQIIGRSKQPACDGALPPAQPALSRAVKLGVSPVGDDEGQVMAGRGAQTTGAEQLGPPLPGSTPFSSVPAQGDSTDGHNTVLVKDDANHFIINMDDPAWCVSSSSTSNRPLPT